MDHELFPPPNPTAQKYAGKITFSGSFLPKIGHCGHGRRREGSRERSKGRGISSATQIHSFSTQKRRREGDYSWRGLEQTAGHGGGVGHGLSRWDMRVLVGGHGHVCETRGGGAPLPTHMCVCVTTAPPHTCPHCRPQTHQHPHPIPQTPPSTPTPAARTPPAPRTANTPSTPPRGPPLQGELTQAGVTQPGLNAFLWDWGGSTSNPAGIHPKKGTVPQKAMGAPPSISVPQNSRDSPPNLTQTPPIRPKVYMDPPQSVPVPQKWTDSPQNLTQPPNPVTGPPHGSVTPRRDHPRTLPPHGSITSTHGQEVVTQPTALSPPSL